MYQGPHSTLKEGSKVISEPTQKFGAHDFQKAVFTSKPLRPIIREIYTIIGIKDHIQPSRRAPTSNLTTPEDSQPMISYRLVYHPKPLGPIISEL